MRRIGSPGQGPAASPGVRFCDSSRPGRAPRPSLLPGSGAPSTRRVTWVGGARGPGGGRGGGCRSGSTFGEPSSSRVPLPHRGCSTPTPLAGCPAGTGDSLLVESLTGRDKPDRRGPRVLRLLPTLRPRRGVPASPNEPHAYTHTHFPRLDRSLPRKVTFFKQHQQRRGGHPAPKYESQHYPQDQIWGWF